MHIFKLRCQNCLKGSDEFKRVKLILLAQFEYLMHLPPHNHSSLFVLLYFREGHKYLRKIDELGLAEQAENAWKIVRRIFSSSAVLALGAKVIELA